MMRKKATKSKEQVLAENYFPVTERDVRYAIEKEHKPLEVDITTITKPGRTIKKTTSKFKKKTFSSKTSKKFVMKKTIAAARKISNSQYNLEERWI